MSLDVAKCTYTFSNQDENSQESWECAENLMSSGNFLKELMDFNFCKRCTLKANIKKIATKI